MKKNLYNSNDEEYQHVIKLLKDLPKENADDNFEYNLSVKIKNKNFDLNSKEPRTFLPWKLLIPASGAIIASIIVFFTLFNDSNTFENPFHIQPKLRSELSGNIINSPKISEKLSNNSIISDNDVIIREKVDNLILAKKSIEDIDNIESPKKNKENFPFETYNSTNLDEVIGDNRNSTQISKRASLAGRTNNSFFNGFYIREEVDKKYVEALKARMDSLKRELKNR